MKTHLTPFQLFLLTFLYVFSGLSLADADSFLALILPSAVVLLWAVIGYRGAMKKRAELSDFLSAYMPKKETAIPLAFFLFTVAAEAVCLLMDAGTILTLEADFIPFPLILAVLVGIACLTARKGVTVLGRLAELSLFLLVPLFLVHLFGQFRPMQMSGEGSGIRLVFSAMPSPVFFLLSMTTVSGDEGTSDGFQSTGNAPKDRAEFLIKTVIGGAGFAVLVRAFLLMFPFGEYALLVYFLEYMAYAVKLSLLFSILAHGFRKKNAKYATVFATLMILAAVVTLAVIGGAVFSPFLWMILLVSLNLTVSTMLGLFALR
jgi:hypothetical protein